MNATQNNQPSDRRSLLRGAALGVAGLAAAGLLLPTNALAQSAQQLIPAAVPGAGDVQVLNFALILEDLEADLYAQALLRLTVGGTDPQASSTVGTITGLSLPSNDPVNYPDVAYIAKFASVEAAHRDFLKMAIAAAGGPVVTTVAPAKYDFGLQTMTRPAILDLVLEAEATGVQAYLGAIPAFTAKSAYLPTAAAIQGTEARHTSILTIVRNLLFAQGVAGFTEPITPVAPLKGDTGTMPASTTYNPLTPNLGAPDARDLALLPNDVYNRVKGFIKTS